MTRSPLVKPSDPRLCSCRSIHVLRPEDTAIARSRRQLALILLVASCIASFGLLVSPALASDCNEPNDCAAAATTARNPLIPIAAAGLGAALGAAVRPRPPVREPPPVVDTPRPEPESPPSPPCQAEMDSLLAARAIGRALLPALQQLRDYAAYLDNLFEFTRLRGYLGAVTDLAFLRQSLMGSSPSGGVASSLIYSVLKGIFKEELKQAAMTIMADGQTFDVGAMLTKGATEAQKKAFLAALKEALTRKTLSFGQQALYIDGVSNAIPKGLDPQGPVAQAVERALRTKWAERLASNATKFVDVSMSVYNMGSGIAASRAMLAEIRGLMSQVRQQIFDLQNYLDDEAMPALDLALSALSGCLKFHIDRYGPGWRERWMVQYGSESLQALQATGIERHLSSQGNP
ncbi:MAG: hypothetical protein A2Z37_03640 [Chloroflexi bacterium RBG_19FT_COMBO_62_14]|nr:MAG: hypothetical protein A2Z37_03640 [Chloroflexi bacterium RBG_19FT_COMBO_62_14]